ncbi:MAG TPA: hypothetical protein VFB78_14020 [Acidimicrobiales bacterium]|nr:hypothetical protein [Acidimicrobiales bacterium]
MTTPAPWSGPRLLVPITVDALVVSSLDREGGDVVWSLGGPDYHVVSAGLDPTPPPFGRGVLPDTGVMLHWALPDGLTHGLQPEESARVEFRLVPNRWLVLRMYDQPGGGRRITKGWVVESDFVSDDPDGGGTVSFPQPGADVTPDTPGVYVGRAVPLESWAGELAAGEPFLQAVGPADATFAAFCPNVRNVFAFQDGLADAASYRGSLAYLVVGWYADPTRDVLAGTNGTDGPEWAKALEEFGWSVGGDAEVRVAGDAAKAWLAAHPGTDTSRPYPQQLLCHGLVFDVPWFGPAGPTAADVAADKRAHPPDGRIRLSQYTLRDSLAPQIAVGVSGADALSAYVAHQLGRPDFEWQLKAFQHGVLGKLSQVDGQDQVTRGIHGATFGAASTGGRWELAAAAGRNDDAPSTPTSDQLRLLTSLNTAAAAEEAAAATLRSRRQLAYALGWRRIVGDDAQSYIDLLTNRVAPAMHRVHDELAAATAARAGAHGALTSLAGADFDLAEESTPRYWRTADPVVLIVGARRSYKHGADGRFADDASLFCRVSGQTIGSLRVPATATTSAVIGANDLGSVLLLPAMTGVPLEVTDLCLEAFLLDTTNAPALAALVAGRLQQPVSDDLVRQIAAQQTEIWDADTDPEADRTAVARQAGVGGTIPSLVGVAAWSPPWRPLFLDWGVTWRPTSDDPAEAMQGWTLEPNATDYRATAHPSGTAVSVTGRTLLTPGVTHALYQQLVDYIAKSGGAALDALGPSVDDLTTWDVLSQTLSGLTDRLVQRRTGWVTPTYADEVVGPGDVVAPDVEVPDLLPIRAGALRIDNLQIVDAFGQVSDPLKNYQFIDQFPWVRDAALTPADASVPQATMYLPPRLCQPARLRCTFPSADDDSKDTSIEAGSSPVCGWLLANYLDGGVAVFDTRGAYLGEMFTAHRSDGAKDVRWAPATTAAPPRDVPDATDIPNGVLRRIVAGLLTPGLDRGGALEQFIAAIDDASWTVNTPNESSANIPALMGRPVAVLRARLALELEGDPYADQGWEHTADEVAAVVDGDVAALDRVTRGLLDVRFPARLGNPADPGDGLLGFFLDDEMSADTYPRLHAVAADPTGAYVSANTEVTLTCRPGQSRLAALLVDPNGVMTVTTGILPTQRVVFPGGGMTDALRAVSVRFRAGPIVTSPDAVRLPVPVNTGGTWTWAVEGMHGLEPAAILPSDGQPRLRDDPPFLREGWLVLAPAVEED